MNFREYKGIVKNFTRDKFKNIQLFIEICLFVLFKKSILCLVPNYVG